MTINLTREVLLHHAFSLIAEKGWEAFQLGDLCCRLAIKPDHLRLHLVSKEGLIKVLRDELKEKLSREEVSFSSEAPVSEKLFEGIMRRFDLMMPYRSGLNSLLEAYSSSILSPLVGLEELLKSITDLCDSLGISLSLSDRWALTISYGFLIQTWSKDKTPDLSKTMSHLDQLLLTLEECSFFNEDA